jgi:hypothetical protein
MKDADSVGALLLKTIAQSLNDFAEKFDVHGKIPDEYATHISQMTATLSNALCYQESQPIQATSIDWAAHMCNHGLHFALFNVHANSAALPIPEHRLVMHTLHQLCALAPNFCSMFEDADDEEHVCAICLEHLGEGISIQLPCLHWYHKNCFEAYAKSQDVEAHLADMATVARCPQCREPVPSDTKVFSGPVLSCTVKQIRSDNVRFCHKDIKFEDLFVSILATSRYHSDTIVRGRAVWIIHHLWTKHRTFVESRVTRFAQLGENEQLDATSETSSGLQHMQHNGESQQDNTNEEKKAKIGDDDDHDDDDGDGDCDDCDDGDCDLGSRDCEAGSRVETTTGEATFDIPAQVASGMIVGITSIAEATDEITANETTVSEAAETTTETEDDPTKTIDNVVLTKLGEATVKEFAKTQGWQHTFDHLGYANDDDDDDDDDKISWQILIPLRTDITALNIAAPSLRISNR